MQRPQSVFALHKALSHEPERSYTPLSISEKVRLQLDTLIGEGRRTQAQGETSVRAKAP